jgi:hypothetical protein
MKSYDELKAEIEKVTIAESIDMARLEIGFCKRQRLAFMNL